MRYKYILKMSGMFKYKHLYRTANTAVRVDKKWCITSTNTVVEGCTAVVKALKHENCWEPEINHQKEINQRYVL